MGFIILAFMKKIMKSNLIIIFISISFLSCNQNKNQQLELKIEELESKLNDIESRQQADKNKYAKYNDVIIDEV